MTRYFAIICFLLLANYATLAQEKFYTKSGKISFFSRSALENITASHKSITCVLDTKSGGLQFSVLMKGFEFTKAKMQEDFNEDYVESDKFPKSEFKGRVTNNSEINYAKEGTYNAHVTGQLTLHGQTHEVNTDGKIVVRTGSVGITSTFTLQLSDYLITIPAVVKEKVSNNIQITVDCGLIPFRG